MKRLCLLAFATLYISVSHGELFRFSAISTNDPTGYSQTVGENQIMLDAVSLGGGQYSLTFENDGLVPSFITQIHFDYTASLNLQIQTINNHSGVDFYESGSPPPNLPHGESIGFLSDLSVLAEDPQTHLGLSPTEYLELIIDYQGPGTLLNALANEDLRIGVHLICIGDYSESFVNVVPEPATFSMALLGSIFMRVFRIRKSRKTKKRPDEFMPVHKESEPEALNWVEHTSKKDRRVMPLTSCEAAVWKTVS